MHRLYFASIIAQAELLEQSRAGSSALPRRDVLTNVRAVMAVNQNPHESLNKGVGFDMALRPFAILTAFLSSLMAALAIGDGATITIRKAVVTKGSPYGAFSKRLPNREMTIQAVDRLTFGPTPGESSDAERIGLQKWLDLQLHPEKISENPLLAAKLVPYESLQMSAREIFLHYPPPQLIAAIAGGRQAPPTDPDLRRVTEQLVARYLQRRRAKDDKDARVPDEETDLEPKILLSSLLTRAQMETLQHGSADEKRTVLAAIPTEQQLDFAFALRPGQRRSLLPLASPSLQREFLLSLAPPQVVLTDLMSTKILRAAYSNHQLEEELVDFWFNHFNVFFNKGSDRYLLTGYERDAIRPHVFGKFYDLLLATAQSPAMLFYLDNAESVSPSASVELGAGGQKRIKRGLNENYGRELMELHTLGVNGGYTQHDVIDVARCFTGWTISPPRRGSVFEFNSKVHDYGQKVVLGHVIRAGGGIEDGLEVLKILAGSPQTARHISLELAQRFVSDNPPPSLVERMAATYMKTNGDLRQVTRTMIFSPEFFSEGAYRAKVKTPFEMIVSALRATNADIESPLALSQRIAQLGEPLYRKIEPTGYSNTNAEWISSASLISRMNFSLALVNNRVAGVHVDQNQWDRLTAEDPTRLARLLLDGDPAPATATAIQRALASADLRQQLTASAKLAAPTVPELVAGLVIGSPEFQRR
jgi:uncharacterized protein (DUF1800 family)